MKQILCNKINTLKADSCQLKATRGYVMLFAVLITSILLTITIGIANVSYKQAVFSSQARDSHVAFFAADTGLECGLYWDRVQNSPFIDQNSGQTMTTSVILPAPGCVGQLLLTSDAPVSLATGGILFDFALPQMGLTVGAGCAHILVTKDLPNLTPGGNPLTRVESRGYNFPCSNVQSQQTLGGSGRLVERVLSATY